MLPKIAAPLLEHFCDLTVDLGGIVEIGEGRGGKRRIIPIVGGTVNGPHVAGHVMNVGADWQTVYRDGLAELDTRYAIQTDDGAIIEVQNFGYRHGSAEVIDAIAKGDDVRFNEYYMRTHAKLETGHPRYDWVNRTLFVGTGGRRASSVELSLFAIR